VLLDVPLDLDIAIEGVQVCEGGAVLRYDAEALDAAMRGEEIEYVIGLGPHPPDGAETEVFFSDLSHEYVSINADYTS